MARSQDAGRKHRVLATLVASAIPIQIEPLTTEPKMQRAFPERVARQYGIVAVDEENGVFTIAMVDPNDLEAVEWLHRYLPDRFKLGVAPGPEIHRTIDELYW